MKPNSAIPTVEEPTVKFLNGRKEAGLFHKLTFTYLYPLLEYGFDHELDVRYHFPKLEDGMEAQERATELLDFWKKYSEENENPKLVKAVIKLYGRRFFISSIGSFLWVATRFAGTVVFSRLLEAFAVRSSILTVSALSAGLLIILVLQAIVQHNGMYCNTRFGLQMKLTCIGAVYKKLLSLS
jgi:hypothetical protein